MTFHSIEDAKKTFDALTGQSFAGRPVRLDYSTPRPPREFGSGDRGGDRGGRWSRGGGGGFGAVVVAAEEAAVVVGAAAVVAAVALATAAVGASRGRESPSTKKDAGGEL